MKPKILIVRFSSLGDLILTTPFYRELKKIRPDAELHLVTSKEFAPIFAHCPHLKKVHQFDRKGGPAALTELAEQLKSQDWDEVFDLHQSLRSRLLLIKLFGSFYRWKKKIHRIDKRSLKRNLLISFKMNFLKVFPSQRASYLKLLETSYPQGATDSSTELFFNAEMAKKTKALVKSLGCDNKKMVAFGSGASFALKRWPKEYFLELGNLLIDLGFQPILMGGPGEEEATWIAEQSGGTIPNIAGDLNFLETTAFLSQCKLAISNDSAIVHFAEAVKTPALALFGPTVKEFGFGPFLEGSKLMEVELKCRPCSRNGKGGCSNATELRCLKDITPEEVLLAALAVIGDSVEIEATKD